MPLTYSSWSATCDTLHAHTQVLGKIAVTLAPPEPQLQHAALRLTARGWESAALPAGGGGALVVGLDLHAHEAFAEHSDGRAARVPLTPDRRGGRRDERPAGRGPRARRARSRSTRRRRRWPGPSRSTRTASTRPTTSAQVARLLRGGDGGRARAGRVPRALPRPLHARSTRGGARSTSRSTSSPGSPPHPPSDDFIMRNSMDAQEVAVGWWPGDPSHDGAAFYAYAHPAPEGFAGAHARARSGPLGRRPRPVPARVGRRRRHRRSARRRARVRPLGLPARVRRLRLGPGPPRLRRGRPAPGRVTAYGRVEELAQEP